MPDADRVSMVTRVCRHVVVVVHAGAKPNEKDWTQYMLAIEETVKLYGRVRTLVLTAGKEGPSAAWRKQLADFGTFHDHRLAVVTDSVVIAGMVTALNWLGVQLRRFRGNDLAGAFAYLGADQQLHEQIRVIVAEAQAQLA